MAVTPLGCSEMRDGNYYVNGRLMHVKHSSDCYCSCYPNRTASGIHELKTIYGRCILSQIDFNDLERETGHDWYEVHGEVPVHHEQCGKCAYVTQYELTRKRAVKQHPRVLAAQADETEKETYQSAYWKFIHASSAEESWKYFDLMVSLVTLTMEPAEGSWLPDWSDPMTPKLEGQATQQEKN